MWELRDSSEVTGGVTAEAVRSLSKAKKTEVWAQARVSVSRAAVSQYCKLGDLKQQKFIVSVFWRLQVSNPGAGRAVLSLKAPGENPFLQPLVFTGLPWCSLASSCSTVVSASEVTWPWSWCLSGSLLIRTSVMLDLGSHCSSVTSS